MQTLAINHKQNVESTLNFNHRSGVAYSTNPQKHFHLATGGAITDHLPRNSGTVRRKIKNMFSLDSLGQDASPRETCGRVFLPLSTANPLHPPSIAVAQPPPPPLSSHRCDFFRLAYMGNLKLYSDFSSNMNNFLETHTCIAETVRY